MDNTTTDTFPQGYQPESVSAAIVRALVDRLDDAFTPQQIAAAIAATIGDGDYGAADDFLWQQIGPIVDQVQDAIEDHLHASVAPRDFSADVSEQRIQGPKPTDAELWQLAHREGFERDQTVLQLDPDPSLPYCAVAYSTLGMEQLHVGAFKVVARDGQPTLTLDVFTETEGPLLATCPPSLIDTVAPLDPDPHSFSAGWRKRCRDFDVIRRLAGGDATKRDVLRDLSGSGRIVFTHIG